MRHRVKSLPVIEVIQDLAQATGGYVWKDGNYHVLTLPEAIGEGTVSGIDFGHGLGMINYACTFNVDTEISFDLSHVHPLKFMYVSQGRLEHRFAVEADRRMVNTYQNLVVASEEMNGHVLYFYAKEPVSMCSIEIDRVRFCKRFKGKFAGEELTFRDLLLDTTGVKRFCYEGEYALAISKHTDEVLALELTGVLRSMFLEGKSYNILVDQWEQYLEDQARHTGRRMLRTASLERIRETVDFIPRNLTESLDVASLAERVDLNEAELQQGIRHLTEMSVNQFVREQRLVKALELLKSGEHNVSETLYLVGFSSLSYFSRKFKERWGLSPSMLRRGVANSQAAGEEE